MYMKFLLDLLLRQVLGKEKTLQRDDNVVSRDSSSQNWSGRIKETESCCEKVVLEISARSTILLL